MCAQYGGLLGCNTVWFVGGEQHFKGTYCFLKVDPLKWFLQNTGNHQLQETKTPKTNIGIFTAVRTSNLRSENMLRIITFSKHFAQTVQYLKKSYIMTEL
jgi:hypothetical protein